MKIRRSFVSNSSTTSFCIYGTNLQYGTNFQGDIDDIQDIVATFNTINGTRLFTQYYQKGAVEGVIVGYQWYNIRDNETGAQFKTRIETEIEKCFGSKLTCCTYQDAWYDG